MRANEDEPIQRASNAQDASFQGIPGEFAMSLQAARAALVSGSQRLPQHPGQRCSSTLPHRKVF